MNQSYKKLIISLITFIVFLGLIFICLIPLGQSIRVLWGEKAQKNSELSTAKELLAKTEQLEKEYQEIEEEAEKIFLALPQEKDIPYLLVQFETLASANGLILESIDFGQAGEKTERETEQSAQTVQWSIQPESIQPEKKTQELFSSLTVSLTVSGSYQAFKKYLEALENNIRAMDVRSISFGSSGVSSAEGLETISDIFDFDLDVAVYYQ